MEKTITIGKNELKYVCHAEELILRLELLKQDFEEDLYVRFYETEDYLTKEEYDENIDELIKNVENSLSTEAFAIEAIENAWKKKNGTFNKTRLYKSIDCDNCVFFTEWHNSWSYHRLKIKAKDDKTLCVYLEKTTSTPC